MTLEPLLGCRNSGRVGVGVLKGRTGPGFKAQALGLTVLSNSPTYYHNKNLNVRFDSIIKPSDFTFDGESDGTQDLHAGTKLLCVSLSPSLSLCPSLPLSLFLPPSLSLSLSLSLSMGSARAHDEDREVCLRFRVWGV